MKTKLLLVLCALLLIAAGCGSQSVPETTEAFCQSLVAYGESLAAFESVSPASSVGELKDAQKAEQVARQDVRDAASNLRAAKLDSIEQAWQDLDKTIRQISNQDTLAEVAAQIKLDLSGVQAAYEQLGTGNCPDLFPPAAALAGPAAAQPEQPVQPITGTESITGTQPITLTEATTTTQPAAIPVTVTAVSSSAETIPAAAPEAPAGPVGTWQLQSIQSATGSTVAPTDPAQYTLTLGPDGTATVTAECISGTGTYKVTGDTIAFSLQYASPTCPPPSVATQYTKYLEYATTYVLENNTLVIWYSYNAGNLTFTQAAP
jgi:heat shock protein HslJ